MILDDNLAVYRITPDVVDYVVKKIVAAVHPAKIILFGSQARGLSRLESDMDLLVVTDPGADREQVRLNIEKALRGRRFSLDLIVRTPQDVLWNVEAENPFYVDDILREGRVVYEC